METNFIELVRREIRSLVFAGYCIDCATIICSPYTLGKVCDECTKKILKENQKLKHRNQYEEIGGKKHAKTD